MYNENAYYNYAQKVELNSTPDNTAPSEITKNKELWKKLAGMQRYIYKNNRYSISVYDYGNLRIQSLQSKGTQIIDNGMGGCEDGAIVMSICAMYLGVDCKTEYIANSSGNAHCVCVVNNPETQFGSTLVRFDATPHDAGNVRMPQEQYQAYIDSLPIIL